ncbi:MAG: hypothetical protein PHZ07_03790, partial [Patescibacteria group bacterium]|nr:hypothetical protein [Patescibacteria group bacterium]
MNDFEKSINENPFPEKKEKIYYVTESFNDGAYLLVETNSQSPVFRISGKELSLSLLYEKTPPNSSIDAMASRFFHLPGGQLKSEDIYIVKKPAIVEEVENGKWKLVTKGEIVYSQEETKSSLDQNEKLSIQDIKTSYDVLMDEYSKAESIEEIRLIKIKFVEYYNTLLDNFNKYYTEEDSEDYLEFKKIINELNDIIIPEIDKLILEPEKEEVIPENKEEEQKQDIIDTKPIADKTNNFINRFGQKLTEFMKNFDPYDAEKYLTESKDIIDELDDIISKLKRSNQQKEINGLKDLKKTILILIEDLELNITKEKFSEYKLIGFDGNNFSEKDLEILNRVKELENKENLINKTNRGTVIPRKFVKPIEIEKENHEGKDLYTIKVYDLNRDSSNFGQNSFGINIDMIVESPQKDFSYEKWFEENKKVEPKDNSKNLEEILKNISFEDLMSNKDNILGDKETEFKALVDIIINSKDDNEFDINFNKIEEVLEFLYCREVFVVLKEEYARKKSENQVDSKDEVEKLKDKLNLLSLDQLIYVYQSINLTMFLPVPKSKERQYYISNINPSNSMPLPYINEQIEEALKKDFSIQDQVPQDIIKEVESFVKMKNLISVRHGFVLKIAEPIVIERRFGKDFVGVYVSNNTQTDFMDEVEFININSISLADKDFDYDKYFEENRNKLIESIPEPEIIPVNTSLVEINKQNYKKEFSIFQKDIKNIDNATLEELNILSKRAELFINYIINNKSKLSKKEKTSIDKDLKFLEDKLILIKEYINNFDANQLKKSYKDSSYRDNLDRIRAKKGKISEESLQFTSLEKLKEAVENNPELKNQFKNFLEIILKNSKDFDENELEKIIQKLSESTGLSVEDIREIYENQQTLIESQAKSEVYEGLKKVSFFKKIPFLKNMTQEVALKTLGYLGVTLGVSLFSGAIGMGAVAMGIAYSGIAITRIIDNNFTDKATKKKQNKKLEEIKQNHSMDDLLARNLLASMTLKKRFQLQNIDLGNWDSKDIIEENIRLYIDEIYSGTDKKSNMEKEDLVKSMSILYQIDQSNKKIEEKVDKKGLLDWIEKKGLTLGGILKSNQNIQERNLTTAVVCSLGIAARQIPVLREILGTYSGYRLGELAGNIFFSEKGIKISTDELETILQNNKFDKDDKEKFALAKVKISEKGFKENNPDAYLKLRDLIDKYEELEVLRLKDKSFDSSAKLIESLNDNFESEISKRKNTSTRKKVIRIGLKVGGAVAGFWFGHSMADMQRETNLIKHINESGKLKTDELNNIMSNPDYARNHNVIEALIKGDELPDKIIHDIIANPDFMKDHGIVTALIQNDELSDKIIRDIIANPDFMKDRGIVAALIQNDELSDKIIRDVIANPDFMKDRGIVAALIQNDELSSKELTSIMSNPSFMKDHYIVESIIRSDYSITGNVKYILNNNPEISKDPELLRSLYESTSDNSERQDVYSIFQKLQNQKPSGTKTVINIGGNTADPDSLRDASPDNSKTVVDSTGAKTEVDSAKVDVKPDSTITTKTPGTAVTGSPTETTTPTSTDLENVHQFIKGADLDKIKIEKLYDALKSDGDKKLIHDALEHAKHIEHIDKGEYVSGLLNKSLTENSKLIVINPDGSVMKDADINTIIHPEDTLIETKDGVMIVMKTSGVTVDENDTLGNIILHNVEKQIGSNLTPEQMKRFDINGDGKINWNEANKLKNELIHQTHRSGIEVNENLTVLQRLQREMAQLNQDKENGIVNSEDYNIRYNQLEEYIKDIKGNTGSGSSDVAEDVNNAAGTDTELGTGTAKTVDNLTELQRLQKEIAQLNQDKENGIVNSEDYNIRYNQLEEYIKDIKGNTGSDSSDVAEDVNDVVNNTNTGSDSSDVAEDINNVSGADTGITETVNNIVNNTNTESGSSNAVEDVINTVSADTESGSSNAVEDVINTVSADTESG